MKKGFYEQLNEVLKDIQKEGKIEDIKIEELKDLYEDEEEYEEVDTNIPTKRPMKATKLKKGLAAAMLALTISGTALSNVPVINESATTVEAASKDKKKPQFTFKGKNTMTVTKGKSVKIPKVTAKDNKDGNVTKKIKVTVKKGKKNYSSIAKKIKENKSVKFTSTGKYIVTYTVTDKAGNKATKKRTITVKAPSKSNPTTETPTYEIQKITVGENTYNINQNAAFHEKVSSIENQHVDSPSINLDFEHFYDHVHFDVSSGLAENYKYLKYIGKITATDANGNDISDNIIISVNPDLLIKNGNNFLVYIYVNDSVGNEEIVKFLVVFQSEESMKYDPDLTEKLSEDPMVYAVPSKLFSGLDDRKNIKLLSYSNC